MNNVTKLNARGTTVNINEPYYKYELYVKKEWANEFESELLNKEFWTWLSRTEAFVI